MAKHRLNRRKPNVTPKVSTAQQKDTKAKRKPIQHSKHYYKPKTPTVSAPSTRAISTTSISKSAIRKQQRLERKQKRLRKKFIKDARRKQIRELRQEAKNIKNANKKHSLIRQGKKYKVEQDLNVSRETYDEPYVVSWDTEYRNADDMRTEGILEEPQESASDMLYDMILYLYTAKSNLELSPNQGGWNGAGVKKLDEAYEKLQELLNMEQQDPEKFQQIVSSLNASKDMSRVIDIVALQVYQEVEMEATELLDVVEGVLSKFA